MTQTETKTMVDISYSRLKEDIINGQLVAGSKLPIGELQKRYQAGAGPLREALNRLAGECVVVANSQSGFTVSGVSLSDLREVTKLRVQLECEVLTESISKGDEDWEANIVAAFYRMAKAREQLSTSGIDEVEYRNELFHESLIAACQSKWLLRFRKILFNQHKRYRILAFRHLHESSERDVVREHELIKDAALDRDVTLACQATREHIILTMESCERILKERGCSETVTEPSPLS